MGEEGHGDGSGGGDFFAFRLVPQTEYRSGRIRKMQEKFTSGRDEISRFPKKAEIVYELRRMAVRKWIFGILGVTMLFAPQGLAEDAAWDVRLARLLSVRLKEIGKEVRTLEPQLKNLPGIPIDDQGGTGGFAGIHGTEVPQNGERFAVEVSWGKPARVDSLALVPARRYDENGLEALYGLPDDFTVELLDGQGEVVAMVANERDSHSHPVRKGHPFFYQIQPPVEAAGLRISAKRLQAGGEDEGNFVHAWAEVFVYAGEQEIAHGAKVTSIGGSAPSAPWLWKSEFLVDGQTPLGLPELPVNEHLNVGWLSEGRRSAEESLSLNLDLGKNYSLTALRLVPAKKPTSDLPSGFGFPKKLAISVSESGNDGSWAVIAEAEFHNPGHNPVLIPAAQSSGRFLRIEVNESWKMFDNYPAFLAFSEVEAWQADQNVALGKVMRSPDGMLNIIGSGGRTWSIAALTDGYGPDGKLVSSRQWVGELDKRLHIETRIHELKAEAGRVINGWRNTALTVFVLSGLAGALAIIALPIRYRIHSHRELMKVRERIAGDLHDEVGSNLGSIQMYADLAEGHSGHSEELKRIQRIAAETVSAVRDIVWLLRPEGDHRIGPVEHLRETSSIMLEMLEWKFSANEASWALEFPEESNRHLFLYFREALHNILRHAKANHVEITVETTDNYFKLIILDDGVGISPERLKRPSTFRALHQRAAALDAEFIFRSDEATGTQLDLTVPLGRGKFCRPLPPRSASENS